MDYLVAIEGVRTINSDSECSYAARRVKLPEPPYRDLFQRIPPESKRGLEAFMQSTEWSEKIKSLKKNSRQVVEKLVDTNDKKTACGMWVGFAVTELNSARRNFENTPAPQPVASRTTADPCHSSGEFASNVALARLSGTPLAKLLSDLQARQLVEKQINDLIIEIYKDKLLPIKPILGT